MFFLFFLQCCTRAINNIFGSNTTLPQNGKFWPNTLSHWSQDSSLSLLLSPKLYKINFKPTKQYLTLLSKKL